MMPGKVNVGGSFRVDDRAGGIGVGMGRCLN